MMQRGAGTFCWVDLAATDARQAKGFYEALFGWRAEDQQAAGGTYSKLRLAGADIGSLYQLSTAEISLGVGSHWTPYVQVADVREALKQALALGARCVVDEFEVPGTARISLIVDPGGALLGLWEARQGEGDGTSQG